MKNNSLIASALTLSTLGLALAMPGRGLAAEMPIRVLIVDGFSNHDWQLTTALIRGIIEVYCFARGPALNLTVLSYGRDPRTEMNWPLEWTVNYGRGRVYTSTFGHVWKGDV